MAFETKQEVLERVLAMPKPRCPHCDREMQIWEVPPVSFGDGLGWGTPYMFVCFNDDCPLYTRGWQTIQENYAHHASCRAINYPGTKTFECMPVFSPTGGTGQIIDDETIAAQEVLKASIKRGFSILAGCYADRDAETALRLLLDPTEPMRVRVKAAEILADVGGLEAIDPLKNLRVGDRRLDEGLQAAVQKIHERHYTRECPFCAEIIKKRAKVCKHCGKEITGVREA